MSDQKIALVTGANRGIGKEIVRQLADRGYRVYLGSRDLDNGKRAADEVGAEPLRLDVTDGESVREAADTIAAAHGRLDLLVNNAAIIAPGDGPVSEVTIEALRQTYETNVLGLVAVTQAMLPLLRKAEAARVVNLSSELSSMTRVGDRMSRQSTVKVLAYNSSKAAVNMVTVMLANELRGTGILVNAADPGNCATDMGGADAPRTAAEGAAVVVRMATLDADGPHGELHAELGRLPW